MTKKTENKIVAALRQARESKANPRVETVLDAARRAQKKDSK